MGRLTSIVRGALKGLKKKSVLATLAVVVAASAAGVTMQAVRAERPDCDSNAVMYCGAYNTSDLKNKYNSNPSTRAIYAASPFKISSSAFNAAANGGFVNGYVNRNNTITVGSRVVATNAVTAGREYLPGSSNMNIPGVKAYTRAPSVSFKQASLQAFVKLDATGKFQFAIIKACGNPATGTPTTPPKPPTPSFTMNKKVRLAGTKNDFVEDLNVLPGQKVEYAIAVQNTGKVLLTGVRVKDVLPKGVTYVSGSSYMVTSYDGRHGLPNGITTSAGVGIGRIPAGGTTFVFFQATAPKETDTSLALCSKGKTKLTNTAYAKPIELAEKKDGANIYTCRTEKKPSFDINKKVRKADTSDEFKEDVTAAPGTKLEYAIAVRNTGNVDIPNVLVKDVLPAGVSYIPGSATMTISGGVKGQKVDDKLVTTGFKIPVLKKGATAFVFFKATLPTAENPIVKDCKVGKTKLTNKAHVDPVGSLGPLEDIADAYTCKTVNVPNFEIVKDVRKKGDTAWKQDVTVKYGDSVEYKITVKNTGKTDLKNVLVKDARPTGVDYVNGTLKVNGQNSNADLFGAGVTVPEIKQNASAEITFEAKVTAVKPDLCKDASFRNIASALPEGLTKKEDDAVVKAECLPFNPKVDIEKTTNKTVVDVNGQFVYTLVVTNNGDVDLTNVKVTDPAPEGVQFISSTKPDGTTVNLTTDNFEAVVAKLAKGQKVTFDIISKVTKEMPAGTTNTACVDAPEVPGNPDDCDSIIIKTPKYECRSLNALSLGELKYRFSVLVNKTDDVQLNSVSYNFGDGSETVTVNSQAPVEHQYLQTEDETTYKAIATVKFNVGGEVKESVCETEVTITPVPDEVCPYNPNLPKDSVDCVEPCPYDANLPKDSVDCKPPETPVTPPTNTPTQPPVNVVPNTGTSGVAAGVIGSSASVYAVYAWIESRRALKRK